MRSITQLQDWKPGDPAIDLGAEEFTGGDLRFKTPTSNDPVTGKPLGPTIKGGRVIGETRIYSGQGWEWSDGTFIGGDPSVKTSAVIGALGGWGWTLRRAKVEGGGASGQIQVGLDIGNPNAKLGARVPWRWTLDNCHANHAGSAWIYPQNDSLYILTTPGENMEGRVIGGSYGPAPKGACVKVGGTGGQPLIEGTCGVTLDGVKILTGSPSVIYGICLQGRTSGVTFQNCESDGPIEIKVADSAVATFRQCRFPTGSRFFVTYWWPYWWLRLVPRSEAGPPRNYTGVAWIP